MPASTMPITDVHVYRDDPRCRAINRPATSSMTMMQKLDTKTVAFGTANATSEACLAADRTESCSRRSPLLGPIFQSLCEIDHLWGSF